MAQPPTTPTAPDVFGQVAVTLELRAVKPDGGVFSHTSQDWGVMSEESFHNIEKTIIEALIAFADGRYQIKSGNKT